ncbi:MAG: hypothetical protein ACTSX6_03335 [Candidatus Heimdallarchaeaceae archaeon]
MYENIGTDEITLKKVLMLLFFIFTTLSLIWFTQNISDYSKRSDAQFYWVLALTAIAIITLDFTIKLAKGNIEVIDTCMIEDKTIFGDLSPKLLFAELTFLFLLSSLAFGVINARKETFISSPEMQLIDLGVGGNLILKFLLSIPEGMIFVVVIPPIIFGLVRKFTNSFYLAFVITLFLSPSIFTFYHAGKYGVTDLVGSSVAFVFNFMSVLWLLIMRNALWELVLHPTNNMALFLMRELSLSPLIFGFIGMFIIFIMGMLYLLYVLRKGK